MNTTPCRSTSQHRRTLRGLARSAILALAMLAATAGAQMQGLEAAAYQQFAEEMAREHGFDAGEVFARLSRAEYQQEIIDAITSPAEALPWHRYRRIFLTEARIREGVAFWDRHAETLAQAQTRYGVPPALMVAIIGVESRYGRHRGRHRVLDALRTLAFDYPPRGDFFRRELKQFFLLAREEGIDITEPRGSYAGAMGVPQFISSSYRAYAVDLNGNGRRDLWYEMPDAIGSVANYFHRHRWREGEPVVDRVRVSGERWRRLVTDSLRTETTVGALREAGVTLPGGIDDGRQASLLALEGETGPEHFAAYHNFYVITRYNHSPLYAMAVHQLSQAIATQRGER